MNNLFTELENLNKQIPLAEILRPRTLDEYLGQCKVISKSSPIFNLLNSGRLFSLILFIKELSTFILLFFKDKISSSLIW